MFWRVGLVCSTLAGGCIELALGPQINGGPAVDLPVAELSVPNPTPGLDETVDLRCSRAGGAVTGTTFDFQGGGPVGGRLVVNSAAGTASFVVEESDLGVGLVFTCTATNENGTGVASREVLVFPTA